MNIKDTILTLLFAGFAMSLLYFYDKDYRNTLRTYYICQDIQTKEYMIPLKEHQYFELKNTYIDFNSMYDCNTKSYTEYHANLIKNSKKRF